MATKSYRVVQENLPPRVQGHNVPVRNKRRTKKKQKLKPLKCLFNFLVDYCNRSSLHGLRYIVEPGIHWIERLIWALLFTSSVISAISVISKLSARFQAAETSTVVETTNYAVSELPFPSVTLCPSNRVDWRKALEMEKDIVPTHDLEAVQTYRDVVTTLSTITFGDFDKLRFLENRSLEAFHGLNLTSFLRNVAPTCSDMFSNCWWRDSDRNCCEIFELQRTEYGFCYSFNSETADFDKATYSKELRPRRASSMGDWSGIRVSVHFDKSSQPPKGDNALGVTTFVGHPNSWPSSGRSSGVGTLASITVKCPSTYATDRVLQLDKKKLPCYPNNGTAYIQDYCLTECRRNYTVMHCGCIPFFLMPTDFFNHYVLQDNPFFEDNDSGMKCNCLPECNIYGYVHHITHTALRDSIAANTTCIDVNYESLTMMRYRMDIVYTQLDLLVSFGGVVGLFLGGSILSAIELLYYLTMGLLREVFHRSDGVQEPAEDLRYAKIRSGHNGAVSTVYRVWPLMDYYPNIRTNLRKYY